MSRRGDNRRTALGPRVFDRRNQPKRNSWHVGSEGAMLLEAGDQKASWRARSGGL